MKKIRVNISVDKELLDKAKKKLNLFGGKISTLFNAYLRDFVESIDKEFNQDYKNMSEKIKEMGWQVNDTEQGPQLFHL